MSDKRIVASVTWGMCPVGRAHLGELILFEGPELNAEEVMRQHHHSLWKVRDFQCRQCGARSSLVPMAVMVNDVPPPRKK